MPCCNSVSGHPIMQKLPGIYFWRERIDGQAWAYSAFRRWPDRPSTGVFVLVAQPACGYVSWTQREEIEADLERRLKERERLLFNHYGRDWRNHLCARIITNHPSGLIQVRDDLSFVDP